MDEVVSVSAAVGESGVRLTGLQSMKSISISVPSSILAFRISNPQRIRAVFNSKEFRPRVIPGHTRLPAPNTISRKFATSFGSIPSRVPYCDVKKRSGMNFFGFFEEIFVVVYCPDVDEDSAVLGNAMAIVLRHTS